MRAGDGDFLQESGSVVLGPGQGSVMFNISIVDDQVRNIVGCDNNFVATLLILLAFGMYHLLNHTISCR